MRELDANQLLAKARELAGFGWRWWIEELRAMVPAKVLAKARLQKSRVLVDICERDIAVTHQTGEDYAEVRRITLGPTDPSELRQALRELPGRIQYSRATTIIRVPESQTLRRGISLPLAAAGTLRDVLSHDFDRQMPIGRDQAYFDCRVLSRDKDRKQLRAELIAIKRPTLDRALEVAAAVGKHPKGVELIGDGDPILLSGLLPQARTSTGMRWERRLTAGLCGLTTLLVACTAIALYDRQQAFADKLSQQLTLARSQAVAAQQVEKKAVALLVQQRFLPEQKRNGSVMAVLAEVTRVLPDDAWVFNMEVKGREVRMHGYAPAASTLLGRFAQSLLLENARFRAPLTQAPRAGLERFDLSCDFKGAP